MDRALPGPAPPRAEGSLGGVPRDILSMVLAEGLSLTLAGLVGGAIGAALLARAFSVVLFGVSPNDPLTYVAISLLLLVSAAAACVIPARRATRVDPSVALRAD